MVEWNKDKHFLDPISFYEARGFPQYRVVLMAPNNPADGGGTIINNTSFCIFTNLKTETNYSVVVGVKTSSSSTYLNANTIESKILLLCMDEHTVCILLVTLPFVSLHWKFQRKKVSMILENTVLWLANTALLITA